MTATSEKVVELAGIEKAFGSTRAVAGVSFEVHRGEMFGVIGPDGAGLPPGAGTAAAGKVVYDAKCVACHGADGAGRPNDQLVGGQGTLREAAPIRTIGSYWPYATTLYDYTYRAMPFTRPGTLTPEETYGLVAYLLFLNDIVREDAVMDATTLPKVVMPARIPPITPRCEESSIAASSRMSRRAAVSRRIQLVNGSSSRNPRITVSSRCVCALTSPGSMATSPRSTSSKYMK